MTRGTCNLAWGLALCAMAACNDDTGGPLPDGATADLRASDSATVDGTVSADNTAPSPDRGKPSGDGASAGRIDIFIKGDLTPVTFSDGSVGQTPTNYTIALSRYEVLTAQNDPSPQTCFDHGAKPFLADMSKDNLVGHCETASLKSATYTHGRTRVDWARYTVKGTLHGLGKPAAGTFTFFRAYSDTTVKGTRYLANHGYFTFSGAVTFTLPLVYPPMPKVPGTSFSTKNGKFYWTFAYTRPLSVLSSSTARHWARFNWKIRDAFRWKDGNAAGYKKGVWDVSSLAIGTETPTLYGVSGYHVTASTDK